MIILEKTGREIWLEVDGGVNADNITEIAQAGADTFVAGSAVFGAANDNDPNKYDSIIKCFESIISKSLELEKFSNIKAILFDLDGTLFETDPELSDAINLML